MHSEIYLPEYPVENDAVQAKNIQKFLKKPI